MKIKSKSNIWFVVFVILFLVLIASIWTRGFGIKNLLSGGPKEEIAKKSIDFINKNLLSNGITASLSSISLNDSGLYRLKIKIQDQELEVYVSRDGNMIFPQGIKMTSQEATTQDQKPKEIPKTEVPDVKLFVMSFCPYGNQAEDAMMPVINLLKDKAKIELHYIVSKAGNKYQSLHGDQELQQDIREICVQKYQKDKLWDFIKEINSKATSQNVNAKWEGIAKNLGIDVNQIKQCQTNEGPTLLNQEIKLTDKYKISGSPTLLINETIFQGSRTSEAYKEAICSGFKVAPQECNKKLSGTTSNASSGGCE